MKPHSAPPSMPASIIAGIMSQGEVVRRQQRGQAPPRWRPSAPRKNCPSAPMFHSFMRKASAQARPTRISGVALTSVSVKHARGCRRPPWRCGRTAATDRRRPARSRSRRETAPRPARRSRPPDGSQRGTSQARLDANAEGQAEALRRGQRVVVVQSCGRRSLLGRIAQRRAGHHQADRRPGRPVGTSPMISPS